MARIAVTPPMSRSEEFCVLGASVVSASLFLGRVLISRVSSSRLLVLEKTGGGGRVEPPVDRLYL